MAAGRSNAWLWPALAILLVVVAVALVAAVATPTGAGYGMMGVGWGWGYAFMAIPAVLLIVILIVALGGLGGRSEYVPPSPYPTVPPSAMELLDRRYARGEINREEYLRIRADLTHAPGTP